MIKLSDYRQLIYDKYATCFQDQDAEQVFNTSAADKWGKAYDYYLRNWLPESKDTNILDIACGRGLFLHFLKKRGYVNITGIDISPEQVSLAKQVTENVIEGNVLEFLATTKKKYDLIIGLDIIEHFRKDEVIRLLNSIHEVLKPRGRLILQTPNADSPFGAGVFGGDFTHETYFSTEGMQHLLKLCSFSGVETRETGPVPKCFKSLVRYIMWKKIHFVIMLRNLIETGGRGSGVFTRVFLISGLRK
ncbi:MAG TPA: class I SAM-dependent methyltransferase [bacterium]|nr:class I SAM-dependent methyltransferase [bacterium]